MRNQILRCDWLPERATRSYLARSGLPAVFCKKNVSESHIINPLLTKFVRSRWLDIVLVLFLRVYGPRRRNLANIQPSLSRAWSITHINMTERPCFTTFPNTERESSIRHVAKDFKLISEQCHYLGNGSPTPPLTQHVIIS